MCGFVGIFDTLGKRPIDEALLRRMNEVQRHRGPDDAGDHVESGIGLAHRRLSIIDLTSGRQPMYNEDGSVVVVYNGEIYNFKDIQSELIGRGHTFRTRCDTEVIIHAWEEWGASSVDRFRGMFAFALWDRRRATLTLVRDRLGIKPLYYASLRDGQVLFASELKGLLEHPQLPRDIEPQAVEDYFAYGYVPDPKSILRAVRKLPPGHILTLRRGLPVPDPRCYWDVDFSPRPEADSDKLRHELIERLREAVRIRMIADVPLGAFLSGGIDSSSVVAMMAGLNNDPINTCAISFGDPNYDESRYAAIVANRYQTDHHVKKVDLGDYSLIDKLTGIYDEPFADSSAIPTYRLCELARSRVKVALSGDGGDETLAGYERYRHHVLEERVRRMLPQGIRCALFGPLGIVYPKADWAPRPLRAKSTLQALALDTLGAYFHTVSVMGNPLRAQLFTSDFKHALGGYEASEVLRDHAARGPVEDPLSQIQYLDIKTYLSGDILVKVDRASMTHSLEVRVPMLDHLLVEWMSGLPPRLKLNGGETKYLFKKALEPYLSCETLYRGKMGFSVPLATWFRGPLGETIRHALLRPRLAETGMFERSFLERLLRQHQAGLRDNSAYLWSLLTFDAFLRSLEPTTQKQAAARIA